MRQGFDLDGFLDRPLVARVATVGRDGPVVRPLWYLWEEGEFWWLTGGWSKLGKQLERDPRVAIVVDTCDLESREVLQATARGAAEVRPFDADRARRWGARYLGPDEASWGRFRDGVFDDPSTRFVRLTPVSIRARDLSFSRSSASALATRGGRGRLRDRDGPRHVPAPRDRRT